jgi:hypothetical protein
MDVVTSTAPRRDRFDALRCDIERHGIWKASTAAAFDVANRFMCLRILKAVTIERPDSRFTACEPAYRGEFIPESTLRSLANNPANEIDQSFLDRVLPRGDECYGFFAGNALASYGWYSSQPSELDLPGLVVHFDARYKYMYKGHTHHDHRGHRLHAIGMTRALTWYLARGYRGLVAYVEWHNADSLKSCYRMGYRDFGNIYVTRIFGRYFVRMDAGCRQYGFRLERTAT